MAKSNVHSTRFRVTFKKRYVLFLFIFLMMYVFWKKMQPPDWWRFSLTEQITQQPVIYRDNIIVATNHGTLISINQRTGKAEWTLSYEKEVSTQPFIRKDVLYTGYVDGTIVAINPQTGKNIWHFTIPDSKLLYTGLSYSETILMFGDSGGVVHGLSLSSGREQWKVETPNPDTVDQLLTKDGLSWFGSIIFDRGKLYVTRTHGYIAQINSSNGNIDWEQKTGSRIQGEPVLTRTTLLVSTVQHSLISLSRQSGEISLSKNEKTNVPVVCQTAYSPNGFLSDLLEKTGQKPQRTLLPFEHELSEQVIQVDSTGNVTSFDRTTLDPSWQTQLGYSPNKCFFDQDAGFYISSKDGQLSKVDLKKQKITWHRQLETKILSLSSVQKPQYLIQGSTKKYYFTDMMFVSDDHEQLIRINTRTGENTWTFKTDGSLYVPPLLHVNELFILSTNGGMYRLNATTGKPDISGGTSKVKLKPLTSTVNEGHIYELSLTAPSDIYLNPYTAVNITAEFSNEDGTHYPIQGFYYDTNEWRVRFNPPVQGKWNWSVSWRDSFQTTSFTGSFVSTRSFTPLHTAKDGMWLTKDDKTIQPIVGINDCISDFNKDGSPLNDFYVRDGGMKVATISGDIPEILKFNMNAISLNSYLDTYKPGFNIFRESVSNCSPPLYYGENFLYSRYLSHEGSYYDTISQSLFSRGYSVWFTIFGFSLPFDGAVHYPDERVAIENYVKYVIARYGAYVDVWEVSNEAVATDEYVQVFAKLLHENDPLHRLVTVSWDKPSLKEIGLIAPHWYQNEGDNQSDLATITKLQKFKDYKKPIIFAEQGNQLMNWDPTSAERMRVRIWTAFFHQAGMIFWNQSSTKNFYNPTYENSNIYLGDDERLYASNFLRLTEDLPTDLVPGKDPSASAPVRSYTLKNNSMFLQYSFHGDYTEQITTTLTNPLGVLVHADWFDPQSGNFIRRDEMAPGSTITSPVFFRDLFVKVRTQ